MSICVSSVFVSCVSSGLATAWSPVQTVLPTAYKISSSRLPVFLMWNRPESVIRKVEGGGDEKEELPKDNIRPMKAQCTFRKLLCHHCNLQTKWPIFMKISMRVVLLKKKPSNVILLQDRAIAQDVSRRLPTAAAWIQTRVWSCGILWWTNVALGQVFSENFGFPGQSTFHLLLHNHSHSHPRLAQ
jgi:hypothetical protein